MVICTLCRRLNVYRPRLLKSPHRHPETIKSDDMQRPTWSSAPFVEDLMSIDQDYFSLPFVIRRQSSPMTRRDQHGHLHPLSKTQCLSTKTIKVSPSSSRDNQVRWHAEINMVICTLCRRLNVYRPRLLKSPLRHPETIKSDDTQRPMWSSAHFFRILNVFRPRQL